jgi:hypothetical protein
MPNLRLPLASSWGAFFITCFLFSYFLLGEHAKHGITVPRRIFATLSINLFRQSREYFFVVFLYFFNIFQHICVVIIDIICYNNKKIKKRAHLKGTWLCLTPVSLLFCAKSLKNADCMPLWQLPIPFRKKLNK